MITPKTCNRFDFILNNTKPNTTVFKGTKEFKMDVMLLSTSVSAYANKKEGKKLPRKPESANHFHWFLFRPFRLLNPNTKIIRADITSRKLPNCSGLNPNSPFLIKIKELPQIKERSNRRSHFFTVLDMT